ncbi:hypothetical protein [Nonomuraea dietziae]
MEELGHMMMMRLDVTLDHSDVDELVSGWEQALNDLPEDDPGRVAKLSSLGADLLIRHARTGALEDLDRSIAFTREALRVIPDDHPYGEGLQHNLNVAVELRSQLVEGDGQARGPAVP